MFYSQRIVDEWNSLSEEVVMSPTLNCFKKQTGQVLVKQNVLRN